MNNPSEKIETAAMAIGGIGYFLAAGSYVINHFSGILF